MKKRALVASVLSLALLGAISVLISFAGPSEAEPNDSPATASQLTAGSPMAGAISPAGDVDYFKQNGINSTWGFIALLDTISSTISMSGMLQALGNDGTTVLQSDTGSWERGSGIALQNYADGRVSHYLRVSEAGDDSIVTTYSLRYYDTVVAAQPEAEPNNTPASGTPSSFTNSGTISPTGDVDCFAFHGRIGDNVLIALNAEGGNLDPLLDLYGPAGNLLKLANRSGAGGKEFIEFAGLPGDGVYAFCVSDATGGGGPTATYKVGLTREDKGLYFPSYSPLIRWLNPGEGKYARIGDLLTFRLSISNTSPITIPGEIDLSGNFPSCLSLASAVPAPTTTNPGQVSWAGQKNGLAPGEHYSVTMTLSAEALCSGEVRESYSLAYFFTGGSVPTNLAIFDSVYLPLALRASP